MGRNTKRREFRECYAARRLLHSYIALQFLIMAVEKKTAFYTHITTKERFETTINKLVSNSTFTKP